MLALYEEGEGDGLGHVDCKALEEIALVGVRREGDAISSSSSCSETDIVGVTGGVGRKLILLEAMVLGVLVGVTITIEGRLQSQFKLSTSATYLDIVSWLLSAHSSSRRRDRTHWKRARLSSSCWE